MREGGGEAASYLVSCGVSGTQTLTLSDDVGAADLYPRRRCALVGQSRIGHTLALTIHAAASTRGEGEGKGQVLG